MDDCNLSACNVQDAEAWRAAGGAALDESIVAVQKKSMASIGLNDRKAGRSIDEILRIRQDIAAVRGEIDCIIFVVPISNRQSGD